MNCPCCNSSVQKLDPAHLGPFLPIVGQQRIIFDLLAKNFCRAIPTARLIDAVYADADGGPDDPGATLRVQIHQLRKLLKRYRLTIVGFAGARRAYGSGGDYVMCWVEGAADRGERGHTTELAA